MHLFRSHGSRFCLMINHAQAHLHASWHIWMGKWTSSTNQTLMHFTPHIHWQCLLSSHCDGFSHITSQMPSTVKNRHPGICSVTLLRKPGHHYLSNDIVSMSNVKDIEKMMEGYHLTRIARWEWPHCVIIHSFTNKPTIHPSSLAMSARWVDLIICQKYT